MALLKSARVSYGLKILSAEVLCVLSLPTHGFVSHINKERGVSSRAGHSTMSAGRSTLLTPTEMIHQSFTSKWKLTSSPALVHEAFSAFSYETGTLLNCIAPLLLPLLFFFSLWKSQPWKYFEHNLLSQISRGVFSRHHRDLSCAPHV